MGIKGQRVILIFALICVPYIVSAQIERFKMYEKNPEISDTNDLQEYTADSTKIDYYRLGYLAGKKYSKEYGSSNTSSLIGDPVLEPEELMEISAKQNKSADYQKGFEDGYYGKAINEDGYKSDANTTDNGRIISIIIVSAYFLVVFAPIIKMLFI